MMIAPITLAEIEAARERIRGSAIRTPLVRLNSPISNGEIYLKLENLQPIGSFKLRGAGNAIGKLLAADGSVPDDSPLRKGIFTASAGNMAQGVAWQARRLGLPCTVLVPDNAPKTKLAAIKRLGADIVKISYDAWWQVMLTHTHPLISGHFVHPVSDPAVIAGNGTIGLELLEDLPDVDAVVIPYGGGGLTSGIASALRARKPETKIYAVEVETAAPLAASLAAGEPRQVDYQPSFVDGIGGKGVLPDMWPLVSKLVDAALVVTLEETAAALRLLAEGNRIIAEGAGAAPVAAAMAGKAGNGKVACIVSGGNIDITKLVKIFQGELP